MPLMSDVESRVTWAAGGKPAVRRMLRVRNGGAVSFDTHSTCITDKEWHAAVNRMNTFFDKLLALMEKFRDMDKEAATLNFGTISDIDFRTVHPDACSHREQVLFTVRVRAFGLETEVET